MQFELINITSEAVLQCCSNLTDAEIDLNGESEVMDTIFISSYPKSGTTWMQNIVYTLIKGSKDAPGSHISLDHISNYSPFFEAERTWSINSKMVAQKYRLHHEKLGYRVFNTHLLWEMMPKAKHMKYIYIVRNGKDVCLSFYQHLSHQADSDCYEGSFEEFVADWCDGKIIFGSWLKHMQSWHKAFNESDVLFLTYQDLVTDIRTSVRKIIAFIQLTISDEKLDELLPMFTFAYMRENQDKYMPTSVPWKPDFNFLRKGVVGEGQQRFLDQPALQEKYQKMLEREFASEEDVPQWLRDWNVL
mmetsp:Transcript_8334/g.12423  ORF Transcript_8334/g.12423 Transcript_8334/m.12423 type:complete len:303 (+) Transcript_8334:38-946(+)